ncbi:MAG: hypothetical protein ABIS21_01375 [Acidimicrobiales bacterium]
MRNRLVALSAVVAFAVTVTAVAVVAGSRGDGDRLERLSFAFGGGAERSIMDLASPVDAYPDFGPREYRVRGELADLGDKAPAYRLGDAATDAAVAGLASRLRVGGDVEENEAGWTVRADGRELNVGRTPGLPWYLSSACPDMAVDSGGSEGVVSSGCVQSGVVVPDGGASPDTPAPPETLTAPSPVTAARCAKGSVECAPATEAPTTSAPAPCPSGASCASSETKELSGDSSPGGPRADPPPTVRPADLPTKAEADRLGRSFYTDLGVALDGFEVRDGFVEWHAGVQPRVGGLATVGWAYSVSFGPQGRITTANGFLAEPDRIGDYPLAGTAKGLERLRAGEGVGPRPLGGAMEGVTTAKDADCAQPTVICDPPPPVTTVPSSEQPTLVTAAPCPPDVECAAPEPRPGWAPYRSPVPPASVPPTPAVFTITGVHLALQQVGPALVPVYVFELEGGGETFPVPAVTDEWIAETQPDDKPRSGTDQPIPLPEPPPSPLPTEIEGVPATRP